jgi:hypothetical protein
MEAWCGHCIPRYSSCMLPFSLGTELEAPIQTYTSSLDCITRFVTCAVELDPPITHAKNISFWRTFGFRYARSKERIKVNCGD